MLLVLFLGLIIGSGLGMGLAAAVPERPADSAAPDHATPKEMHSGQRLLPDGAAVGHDHEVEPPGVRLDRVGVLTYTPSRR